MQINSSKYESISSQTFSFGFASVSVHIDGIMCAYTRTSILLNTHAWEAYRLVMSCGRSSQFRIWLRIHAFSLTSMGFIILGKCNGAPMYHIVNFFMYSTTVCKFDKVHALLAHRYCQLFRWTTTLCKVQKLEYNTHMIISRDNTSSLLPYSTLVKWMFYPILFHTWLSVTP